MNIAPPRNSFINVPIVAHIETLYKNLYLLNSSLSKRDKLGIHTNILNIVIEILKNSIDAGLLDKNNKLPLIKKIRRDIETCKHLIRIEYSLKILTENFYIKIIQDLEKISMMTNSWIKYIESRSPQA